MWYLKIFDQFKQKLGKIELTSGTRTRLQHISIALPLQSDKPTVIKNSPPLIPPQIMSILSWWISKFGRVEKPGQINFICLSRLDKIPGRFLNKNEWFKNHLSIHPGSLIELSCLFFPLFCLGKEGEISRTLKFLHLKWELTGK